MLIGVTCPIHRTEQEMLERNRPWPCPWPDCRYGWSAGRNQLVVARLKDDSMIKPMFAAEDTAEISDTRYHRRSYAVKNDLGQRTILYAWLTTEQTKKLDVIQRARQLAELVAGDSELKEPTVALARELLEETEDAKTD